MPTSVFIDQLPTKNNFLSAGDKLIIQDSNTFTLKLSTLGEYMKSYIGGSTKFVSNIGNGTDNVYTVIHNLNSRDLITNVYDNTTFYQLTSNYTVLHTTTNTITLSFPNILNTANYRVVILG